MSTCDLGHENADGARFCTVCGSQMPDVPNAGAASASAVDPTNPATNPATSAAPTATEVIVGTAPVPPNRRPLIIGLAIGLAVVVIGAVVFAMGALSKADVPDVTGLTAAEAQTSVEAAGLEVGNTAETFDDTVPEGQVISQVPVAGEQVDKGSPVSLVVSKGIELVTVTMKRDLSDIVLELDFADCNLAVTVWQGSYANSELVDGEGEVLSPLSGTWEGDSANQEYFPCEVVGTFADVPANRDEYRVVYEPDDPEDNQSSLVSRGELEGNDWTIAEG